MTTTNASNDDVEVGGRFRLVLLDFDGTLCLGDDPVLLYAQLVDEALAEQGGTNTGVTVRDAVQRGLDTGDLRVPELVLDAQGLPDGVAGRTDMVLWPLQDGYQLVQVLALQAGLTPEQTNAAFLAARTRLLGRGLAVSDVHAPEGAAQILADLRNQPATVVVLVTNSPAEEFDVWLTHLGLVEHFDLVINSAKKPGGMPAAVEQARNLMADQAGPVPMGQVVSIGDIWANDLAYVHAHGGTTVLIDRFNTGVGDPDHRLVDAASALQLLHQVEVKTT